MGSSGLMAGTCRSMCSEQLIPAYLQPLAVCHGLVQLLVPAGGSAVRLVPYRFSGCQAGDCK